MTRQDIIDASSPNQPGAGVRANYIAQGVQLEQERIIKLIESERDRNWMTAAPFVRHIVALIKGETE